MISRHLKQFTNYKMEYPNLLQLQRSCQHVLLPKARQCVLIINIWRIINKCSTSLCNIIPTLFEEWTTPRAAECSYPAIPFPRQLLQQLQPWFINLNFLTFKIASKLFVFSSCSFDGIPISSLREWFSSRARCFSSWSLSIWIKRLFSFSFHAFSAVFLASK